MLYTNIKFKTSNFDIYKIDKCPFSKYLYTQKRATPIRSIFTLKKIKLYYEEIYSVSKNHCKLNKIMFYKLS